MPHDIRVVARVLPNQVVNVTVPRLDCGVWGPDGTRTRSQVIQDHDGSLILFFVASVPPLGVSTYFVGVLDAHQSRVKSQTVDCSTEVMLGNSFLRALFKANALPNNGACELARLENTASRVSADVTAAVLGYPAAFNTSMGPVSNAYWFIPSADAAPVDWTGSDTPPRTDSTVRARTCYCSLSAGNGLMTVPLGLGQPRRQVTAVLTTGPLVQQLYVPLTGTASITYRLFASGDPTVDGRLELIEHVPTLPVSLRVFVQPVSSAGVARWSLLTIGLNTVSYESEKHGAHHTGAERCGKRGCLLHGRQRVANHAGVQVVACCGAQSSSDRQRLR